MKEDFPRITELGVQVYHKPIAHVLSTELLAALDKKGGETLIAKFGELFGVQTCPLIPVEGKPDEYRRGKYPWDVEAVLERMTSGKLTGTQLIWD